MPFVAQKHRLGIRRCRLSPLPRFPSCFLGLWSVVGVGTLPENEVFDAEGPFPLSVFPGDLVPRWHESERRKCEQGTRVLMFAAFSCL